MPQLSTTYQPGSVTTATEGAPVSGGDPQLTSAFHALIAAKLSNALKAAQRPAPAPMASAAPVRAMAMDRLGAGGSGGRDEAFRASGPEQLLQHLRQRDEIMQQQARQNPAPMRMMTGPGITPGYVMDTNAMNAYQRQAYLPKESAQAFGPEDDRRARTQFSNDAIFGAKLATDRARTNRAAGGGFEY